MCNKKRYIIVSYHMFGDGNHGYYDGKYWNTNEEYAALYPYQAVCNLIIKEIQEKKFVPCYVVTIVI